MKSCHKLFSLAMIPCSYWTWLTLPMSKWLCYTNQNQHTAYLWLWGQKVGVGDGGGGGGLNESHGGSSLPLINGMSKTSLQLHKPNLVLLMSFSPQWASDRRESSSKGNRWNVHTIIATAIYTHYCSMMFSILQQISFRPWTRWYETM